MYVCRSETAWASRGCRDVSPYALSRGFVHLDHVADGLCVFLNGYGGMGVWVGRVGREGVLKDDNVLSLFSSGLWKHTVSRFFRIPRVFF